jgi:hypothetical protein
MNVNLKEELWQFESEFEKKEIMNMQKFGKNLIFHFLFFWLIILIFKKYIYIDNWVVGTTFENHQLTNLWELTMWKPYGDLFSNFIQPWLVFWRSFLKIQKKNLCIYSKVG